MHAQQVGRLGADRGALVFRDADKQIVRRRRTVKLHQVERPHAVGRRRLAVDGQGRQGGSPRVAQLLLHVGHGMPGPGAGELRLANRPGDALAAHRGRGLAFLGGGHDAKDRAGRVAAAHRKVEPTVGPHVDIGAVERLAFQENLGRALVRGRRRLQRHGHDPPLRPVAHEKRVTVLVAQPPAVVKHHAGRRAAADIDRRRQAVDVILRPLRPAAPPAELGPGHQVVDPRRPVPGQRDVPLHVRVVREQLAVAIERTVVGVAKAPHEQLDEAAVGVGPHDRAAGRLDARGVAVGVFVLRRDQLAVVEMMVRAGGGQRRLDEGVVADDDVNEAVRAEHRRMRPMLAHAALELEERFDALGGAVVVGIGQPVEGRARGAIAHGEHVAVPSQDALAVVHLGAEVLDRLERAVVVLVLHQQERTPFARGDDVARFVEAHCHERTGRVGRDDLFDGKTRQRGESLFERRRGVGSVHGGRRDHQGHGQNDRERTKQQAARFHRDSSRGWGIVGGGGCLAGRTRMGRSTAIGSPASPV